MSGKSALLLGATGATGRHVLRELLASKQFDRVGEYGRRVTPKEQLGDAATSGKLEQKVIDFENLDAAGLKDGQWDIVYITLGTTRGQAGSAAAFEKIDREYVVNAARAAKADSQQKQRLVYLSSGGANASSPFLYMKSKGLTENALASLGYSDTVIFRPGYLDNANRANSRLAESLVAPLIKLAERLSDSVGIDVSVLAKSIVKAGILGSDKLPPVTEACKGGSGSSIFTIIGNKGALKLASDAV